jgi:hypothetical protein
MNNVVTFRRSLTPTIIKLVPIAFVWVLSSCTTHKTQADWYLLHREDGCITFDEEDGRSAFAQSVKTPSDLFAYLKKTRLPDAEMMPWVDYSEAEEASSGRPRSKEDDEFSRAFNRENAFIIFSKDRSTELVVMSRDLCRAIGGFQKK